MEFVSSRQRLEAMLLHDPWKIEQESYPEPEVRSDWDMMPVDTPGSVIRLMKIGQEAGWQVKVQYSRGRSPHATTGVPGTLRHLIGVRFGHHPLTDHRGYAIATSPAAGRVSWTWDSTMIWGPGFPPYADCSITDFTAFLTMPDTSDEALKSWAGTLADIKANGEALQKSRDAARKAIRAAYDDASLATGMGGFPGVLAAAGRWAQIRALGRGLYEGEALRKIIDTRTARQKDGFR